MATRLVPNLRTKYFDQNGAPLAGGLLHSYVAGTSTPLATYTDVTGLTPNSNPVVLDANGEADVWISTAIYKFVLTDSLGVVQWTEDQVDGRTSTAANGVPVGGTAGQVLAKIDGVDFNTQWVTPSAGTKYQGKLTGTYSAGDTTYTLPHTPLSAAGVFAVLGAVPQGQDGTSPDYAISGTTITFTGQDTSSEKLLVIFDY